MKPEELTKEIIGAAIEVHKALGPGSLESAYEESPCDELRLRELAFERQRPLPVAHKGVKLDCGCGSPVRGSLDDVVEERSWSRSSASTSCFPSTTRSS